ncbi:extracellular solute-binding protein [Paenibacillus thiaminolyticus]|uniref:extracellular solute-binding protein n=1 Tax=Paenibacillus thiaminolyticus TaxID=49283 RepID=UPI0035A5F3F0
MPEKKVVAAMLLILCLAFTSACSKGADDTSSAKPTERMKVVEEGEAGPWGKYSEPVTLTRAQMTTTASQWQNGDTAENNPWTREALEKFNIKVEDEWAADASQYNNKINLSIASNTLPDVFWADSSQFAQVVKSGLAADLTDVFEKYASPKLKEIMAADEVAFNSGKKDGKLMGISTQHYGAISQMNAVWIRQDWMKNLGLSAPKTMDDLINICEQFTNNDPDGNGKNDTYGLAMDKTLGAMYALMPAYHANPQIWLTDDSGATVYGSVQDEVKPVLQAFQNMYSKGILSKEFGVKDSAKLTEDIVSGKVGVAIWGSSFGYSPGIDVVKNNGTEAIFMPYAIPSADGEEVKLSLDWPVGNYVVVNKDCKYPEAVIKMLNLYVEITNEGTAEDYNTFKNNERDWGAIPFQVQNPMADYNQHVAISAVQDTRDTSSLKPDQLGKYEAVIDWIDNKNPDAVGQFSQVSREGAYSVMKDFVDNEKYIRTEYRGVSTPTMIQKNTSLKTLEAEIFTKIIMGQSLDSFNDFVGKWNQLGGEQITIEMNEASK